MRILQVCAEIFPLLKTGGLADVAGALPPALGALGADDDIALLRKIFLFDPDQVAAVIAHLGPAFEADHQFHRRSGEHHEQGLGLGRGRVIGRRCFGKR
ncbi:MAG TPA: glycogen/starch synthase, partial [Thauera aminoaromatica]|nr:glycogen/starch synthase [Thauera aminoaromatica]